MISNKVDRILSKALELTNLSNQNFCHAAIITKGSKPVVFGINNDRSLIRGKIAICSHAEIDAVLKWRNLYFRDVKDKKRKGKKYNLYVVRKNKQGDVLFSNSKPCQSCSKILKQCNFNKIIYSTGNSDIFKSVRISELTSSHKSSAFNYLENNINYFSRLNYI